MIKRIQPGPRMSQAVDTWQHGLSCGAGWRRCAGCFGCGADTRHRRPDRQSSAEAGSDKTKLLSATIWLTDIGTFAEMNGLWMPGLRQATRRPEPVSKPSLRLRSSRSRSWSLRPSERQVLCGRFSRNSYWEDLRHAVHLRVVRPYRCAEGEMMRSGWHAIWSSALLLPRGFAKI